MITTHSDQGTAWAEVVVYRLGVRALLTGSAMRKFFLKSFQLLETLTIT